MKHLTAVALGLAALLVYAPLHAQKPMAKTDVLKQQNVVRGDKLFQQNCAACHGANATGGMGPNLTMSSLVRHDADGSAIGPVLREGRMDKGMPAFTQLTPEQVTDISDFLHARIEAFTRASALGASAFQGSLNVGDATAGKASFQSKCASCHSATGNLKGIASKYDPAELEALMLMPKQSDDTGSVTVAGKKYQGTFLNRDGFTVTLQTADGTTHTWLADKVQVHVDDPLKAHHDLLSTYTDKDIHDVFSYLETLK